MKENIHSASLAQEKTNPSGTWALILGGSSGLGLATAQKLARHGFNIIIVHRDRKNDMEKIQKAFQEIAQLPVQFKSFNADAVHPESILSLVQKIKTTLPDTEKIKVLVHSIAKGTLKPMYATTESELQHQDFRVTIEAMGISLYSWTQLLVREDLFCADSRIISFTSEGNTKAMHHYAAISAAKGVLEAITRNIALEFAPLGIKANCIQAGVTVTAALDRIPGSAALKKNALQRNPNGRLTTVEDVANAAYLLCLEEAQWITGTILKVDGGESLQ
ncbi:SDR family oxidoreductase [Arenibacter sp. GZD96]|uniref:SDR family oxidoreductase n=1 Tax=Aurantibrevibacter litoralis TaxID=3106030 RepID=UPI002AFF87BA|nr:SDR family oxidoreductase [Arenibacter sp. GZD-96]MEA1786393.1 SDR family oxidoreductase [Arenibacter sp. GZD-96]